MEPYGEQQVVKLSEQSQAKDAMNNPLLPDVKSEEQSPQGKNESLVMIDDWLIWGNKLMFNYK